MKRRRILLLSPWMPWPPHDGGRIRIFNTLRYLSQHHDVTLAAPSRTPDDVDAPAELRDHCQEIVTADLRGDSWAVMARSLGGALRRRPLIESIHHGHALAREVSRVTAREPFDIVQVEFSWFTPYLRAIDPACGARSVLVMHNVESLRFQRELRAGTTIGRRLALGADQWLSRDWEAQAVRRVDAVVVVSETELRWVAEMAPDASLAVAPNGVDTDHFRPAQTPVVGSLVFTGSMDYPPNVDAVLWFSREVWPLLRQHHPALRLEIVGRAPAAPVRALHGEAGIRVTGEVPDVRMHLSQASAVVVPLRAGAGTRLKILEAMAMGRPVVSTTLGAEGLDVVHGANVLLADTPVDFASAVDSVLASPTLARRLADAGRRLVVERYDWQRCLAALDDVYERLDPGSRSVASAAS
jgi:sugar transferase (PEP-CTERM/EpsH1 system associated)